MNFWFWRAYAVLFTFTALAHAYYFFKPNSAPVVYYVMLMGFHKAYAVIFFLNILAVLATLASSVPMLCCAFGIDFRLRLWQWLFYLRVFTDLAGHHYEWKFLQTIFAYDILYGLLAVASWLIPLIPSYIAHYLYAFKVKK